MPRINIIKKIYKYYNISQYIIITGVLLTIVLLSIIFFNISGDPNFTETKTFKILLTISLITLLILAIMTITIIVVGKKLRYKLITKLKEKNKRIKNVKNIYDIMSIIIESNTPKLLQEKIDAINSDFRIRIKEKNDEINKLKRKSQLAEYTVNNFLSNVTHELRTPLTVITGFADILLSRSDNLYEKQQTQLKMIVKSGHQLLRLINDLLDLVRLESDQYEFVFNHFYLQNCIENAKSESIENNNGDDFEFVVDLPSNIPKRIYSDEAVITQILEKLISNAMKFTLQDEEKKIFIFARYVEKANEIYLSVKNMGIGIPSERVKEIFDTFIQVDGSSTRKYGGVGIGLALCRKLITKLNGDIFVENPSSGGTVLTFCFPISKKFYEKKGIEKTKVISSNFV